MNSPAPVRVIPASMVAGFGACIGLWIVWFVTHLPWLNIPERHALPALLAYWLLAFAACGFNIGRASGWKVGVLGGVISALPWLMVLGSKLRHPAGADGALGDVVPSAGLIVVGFLATGGVVGGVGAALGSLASPRGRDATPEPDWLARFAWVTAFAAAPLLFVGGLVTSTGSGMAVPDWPGTFGSNMFLYPLGPRSEPGVFLEHSHRLFGSLLGMTAVVLALWTVLRGASRRVRALAIVLPAVTGIAAVGLLVVGEANAGFAVGVGGVLVLAGVVMVSERGAGRWPKVLVLLVLAFIVVQGWLGGTRVLENSTARAMLHGVSAQVIFAGLVAAAAYLSPAFAGVGASACTPKSARVMKVLATATLHATLVQLVLGAVYRHFRSTHVLWTHAAFAVIVVIAALGAAMAALSFEKERGGAYAAVRRTGVWLLALVSVQFVLGWIAFMGAGQGLDTASVTQSLLRTAHQANGAAFLGAATVLFVMARQANRAARGGAMAAV